MPDKTTPAPVSILKKIFLSLLILAAILFLLPFILQSYLKSRIENAVNSASPVYHIAIRKAFFSIFNSSLILCDIQLTTDSDAIKKTVKDSLGFTYVDATAMKLVIKNINLIDGLFRKELNANEIYCAGLNLKSVHLNAKKVIKQQKQFPTIHLPFPCYIQRVKFDSTNVTLKRHYSADRKGDVEIRNVSFVVGLDAIPKNDSVTLKKIKTVDVSTNGIRYTTNDSLYTLIIQHIRYNDSTSVLKTDSVLLQPNYDEPSFVARVKTETDRIDISTSSVGISKFQLLDFFEDRSIRAEYILIDSFNAHVYRDKRKPDDHLIMRMPQQLVYDYKHYVMVDSLSLRHSRVEYKEFSEDASRPSTVIFSDLNGTISKITNDTTYKSQRDTAFVEATALFMNKSRAHLAATIPLYAADNVIYYDGTLGPLKAEDLNPITENKIFVSLTSGKIKSLHYQFAANNSNAKGTMVFLYDSLDLTLINKKTKDTTGIVEKILSFFATKFVIESSNPLPNKPVRVGVIDYQRNREKFIFNYTWKAILSGLKSSVGIGESKK